MANAGFGNLVGNFLQAFTQSKLLSQRSAADEEERKARTKLFEIQLKREQERAQAEERVRTGMAGAPIQKTNITENPGELGGFNIGPRTDTGIRGPGMGLSEALANPEMFLDLAQSGMLPGMMAADQFKARNQLASGFESGQMTGPQATGLMVRSGMQLPQQGSPPESLALLQAAGIDPASPEGRSLIERRIGGSGNGLEDFQAQLMLMQAQNARLELEDRMKDRATADATAKSSTRSLLRNASEMATLNERLEGTVMQTGLPMAELRRGAASLAPLLEQFGFDMQATQQAVADFDRFTKLSQQMAIDLLPKLAAAGTITDTKWESLEKTLMSTGVSTEANRLVTADVIDLGLEAADKLELSLEDRDALENLSQTLRAPRAGGGGTAQRFVWDPATRKLVPKPQ